MKATVAVLALLAASARGQKPEAGKVTCGECMTIQEAIRQSIVYNITAMEKKATPGSTQSATVEIGQIIWKLCGSDAWKEARLQSSFTTACKAFVKHYTDLATNYWKEKSSEEYKDNTLALRMKRAVCANPDVGACELDELPSDYEPLRPDECAVCRAVVGDVFYMVARSRERPTEGKKSDAYFRLVGQLGQVCDQLPMRRAIRNEERDGVTEICDDVWDEHESSFLKLALQRDEEFALSLCSDELEICDDPMTLAELRGPGHDDKGKDEL